MHMLKNLELKKDSERIKEMETIVLAEESNNDTVEQWMLHDSPNLLIENLVSLVSKLKTIRNNKENQLQRKKVEEQNTLKSI